MAASGTCINTVQRKLSSEDSPGGDTPLVIAKSLLQLKLCYYYQTESGCKQYLNCPRWHLCRDFLSGACENERDCKKLHKFYSSENAHILELLKLHRVGEAKLLQYVNISFPAVCTDYNTVGCAREPCPYLHLCRKYVVGKCTSDCGRSHNETDVSCRQIFSKYKLFVGTGPAKKYLLANILLDSKYQEKCRSGEEQVVESSLLADNDNDDYEVDLSQSIEFRPQQVGVCSHSDETQSSDGGDDDDVDDDDEDYHYDHDDNNEEDDDDDDDDEDDEDENSSTESIDGQVGINKGMNMDEIIDDYSMDVKTGQKEDDTTETQSQKKDRQHYRLKICQEEVCQNPIHCEGIHICRDFVSGLCNSHTSCDRSHIFHSPENKKLLSDLHLAGLSESELLKYSSSHLPKVCGKYNCNMCQKDDCNFLHLCQNFVKGCCQTVNPCGFSHKLSKPCNKRILEDHKIQFPVHNKRGVLDTIILDSWTENEAGDKRSGDGIGHGKKCLQKGSTTTTELKSSKATAAKNVETQKAKWKAQKKPKVKHKQNPDPEKIPGGRLDQNQESEHSKGASASPSEKFDGDMSDNSLPTSLEFRLCFFYLQGRCTNVPPSCEHIHICREFLSGLCKKSVSNCCKSHRFHSGNNKNLLVKLNLKKYNESALHRIAKKSLPRVCSNYNRRECKNKNCEMLHLCQNYVRGVCNDRDVCGLSHSVVRPNNQRIFNHFNMNVYVPNISYVLSSVLLAEENTGKDVTLDEDDKSGEVGIAKSSLQIAGNNTAAVIRQVKETEQPQKEEKKSHMGQGVANKSDNMSKGKKQGNGAAASFTKTGAKHNQDVDCTLTTQHPGQYGRSPHSKDVEDSQDENGHGGNFHMQRRSHDNFSPIVPRDEKPGLLPTPLMSLNPKPVYESLLKTSARYRGEHSSAPLVQKAKSDSAGNLHVAGLPGFTLSEIHHHSDSDEDDRSSISSKSSFVSDTSNCDHQRRRHRNRRRGNHRSQRTRNLTPAPYPLPSESDVFRLILQKYGGAVAFDELKTNHELFPPDICIPYVKEWLMKNKRKFITLSAQDRSMKVKVFEPRARLCFSYRSDTGCDKVSCGFLHICKNFVAGFCRFDDKCKFAHSFSEQVTQDNLRRLNLDGFSDGEILTVMRQSVPFVCNDYARDRCSREDDCEKLHLCRGYIMNKTSFCKVGNADKCKLCHDLDSNHTKGLLTLYNLSHLDESPILRTILVDFEGKKCMETNPDVTKDIPVLHKEQDSVVKDIAILKHSRRTHGADTWDANQMDSKLAKSNNCELSKACSYPSLVSEPSESDVFKLILQKYGGTISFDELNNHDVFSSNIDIKEWLTKNKRKFITLSAQDGSMKVKVFESWARMCFNYNSDRGCDRVSCGYLHICKNFVAGFCRFGDKCKFSHSFSEQVTQDNLRRLNLDGFSDGEILTVMRQSVPFVCNDYARDRCSREDNCEKLHLCRGYIMNKTSYCKVGNADKCELCHDLDSNHTKNILKMYSLLNLEERPLLKTILAKIDDKEIQTGELRRWPVNTMMSGAIPKQPVGVSKGPVRHANQTRSESTADTGMYMRQEIQQIPVTPTVPSRAVPKQLAGISGATGDTKLTPIRPALSYQRPSSRPGAVRSSSTNTDPEVEDKKPSFNIASNVESPICVDKLIGKCKNGTRCSNHHCSMPYQWILENKRQVHFLSNPSRLVFDENANTAIEKSFCDVAKTRINLKGRLYRNAQDTDSIEINFEDLSVQKFWDALFTEEIGQLHRLSTPSYSIADPNSNTACSVATRWKWYFKDVGNIWTPYDLNDSGLDLNDMIETAYLAKHGSCSFRTGRFNYTVNFGTAMKQTNLQTLTEREVRRRPAVFVSPTEVKDILTRSLASPVSTPAPSFQFPPTWKPMPKDKEFTRHVLPPSSQRFAFVERRFRKTMDANNTIISIEHIQNPQWWRKYQSQKEIMMKKTPSAELENYLFHGTEEDTVAKICKQNFDFRVAGKNATAYGHGSYFARDAKYSDNYTRNDASGLKERYMFLAQVLVGRYTVGDSSYKRPPEMNATTGDLYDSCVDKMYNPSIFVIFALDQLYPTYLITYRKEERSYGLSSHGSTPTASVSSFTQRTAPSSSYSWSSQSPYSSNQTSNASSTGFRYSSTPQSSSAPYSSTSRSSYSSSQPSSWTSPTPTPPTKPQEPKSSCVVM